MKTNFISSLLFVCIILVLASSCNQSKYNKEINSIDVLLSSLDSSQTILLSLDTSFANANWDSIKGKIIILKTYYDSKKDTVERKESFLVSDYYSMRKPFRTFTSRYNAALKEIKFCNEQLLALKQDLSNNLMKEELVKKHLLIETSATQGVVLDVKKLQKNIELNTLKLKRVQPQIDSLISVIKNIEPVKEKNQKTGSVEGDEE